MRFIFRKEKKKLGFEFRFQFLDTAFYSDSYWKKNYNLEGYILLPLFSDNIIPLVLL